MNAAVKRAVPSPLCFRRRCHEWGWNVCCALGDSMIKIGIDQSAAGMNTWDCAVEFHILKTNQEN